MNAPAQPGVIYVPNVVGQSIGVSLLFQTIGVDNGSNAWNGGTATVSAVVNTASLTVSGTLSDSMSGNPPGQQNYLTVNIDTTGLTSPSEIILEFRVQANSKVLGPQTTTQASASDITNGSALKVLRQANYQFRFTMVPQTYSAVPLNITWSAIDEALYDSAGSQVARVRRLSLIHI